MILLTLSGVNKLIMLNHNQSPADTRPQLPVVQTFTFPNHGVPGSSDNAVRVIVGADGEPWFVAADVCRQLHVYVNPNDGKVNVTEAVRKLDPDEHGFNRIETIYSGASRETRVCVVNESGLYALILRSDSLRARGFRKWVTSEVLPTIRKKGFYVAPAAVEQKGESGILMEILAEMKAMRAERAVLVEDRQKALDQAHYHAQVNVELKPKADTFDAVVANKEASVVQYVKAIEPGVNSQLIQKTLAEKKYLFMEASTGRWRDCGRVPGAEHSGHAERRRERRSRNAPPGFR